MARHSVFRVAVPHRRQGDERSSATALAREGCGEAGLRADIAGDQEARMTIAEAASIQTLIPYLVVDEADQLIAFLKEAFDAELRMRVTRPDGSVMHAQVSLFESALELAEPPKQG